ncbi:MAG: DUF4398 domain-containing protein [Myxococcales bacterium]|nr:DUF4398 domain-containing protein [Myxococcales bacterium]
MGQAWCRIKGEGVGLTSRNSGGKVPARGLFLEPTAVPAKPSTLRPPCAARPLASVRVATPALAHTAARTHTAALAHIAQLALLGSLALLGGLACGSVSAASSISDAQQELDEARGQQADENAPYEYTRAWAYLQKAKKINGQGMYEQASEYARVSMTASEKALDVARLAKDSKKRKDKFSPTKDEDAPRKGAPSFTPSDE